MKLNSKNITRLLGHCIIRGPVFFTASLLHQVALNSPMIMATFLQLEVFPTINNYRVQVVIMKPRVQLGHSGYKQVEVKRREHYGSGEGLFQHILLHMMRNLNKDSVLIPKRPYYLMIYFYDSPLNGVIFCRRGKCTQDNRPAR